MTTIEMTATTIERTALGRLDREGRLLNAVLKGPTTKPGRFGFRGDIALKFQAQLADEKRPPEFSIEQVLTIAQDGEGTIPILAGYLHSFAYLETAAEVLDGPAEPDGTYFMFCNNIDLLAKYRVTLAPSRSTCCRATNSTVWKEMMDLMSIDKNDIKKLDTAGKLDYLLDAAAGFDEKYEAITLRGRRGPDGAGQEPQRKPAGVSLRRLRHLRLRSGLRALRKRHPRPRPTSRR